jgi:hypothetical protein
MHSSNQWAIPWLGFTAVWWLRSIFDGTDVLILLMFQVEKWCEAFMLLTSTFLVAMAVPAGLPLVGWIGNWTVGKFRGQA